MTIMAHPPRTVRRNDGKPARRPLALNRGRPAGQWPPASMPPERSTLHRPRRSRAERGQEVPYTGKALPAPPRPPLQGLRFTSVSGRVGGRPKVVPALAARQGMAAYRAHTKVHPVPQPTELRDAWWSRPPRDSVLLRRTRRAISSALVASRGRAPAGRRC
jgi:hypothetical protein